MSLKIEIEVPQEFVHNDRAAKYLANALAAIGYGPRVDALPSTEVRSDAVLARTMPTLTDEQIDRIVEEAKPAAPTTLTTVAETEAPKADAAPTRERGKPSPGAKRRTKEEVAEDLAAEKAELEAASTGQGISSGAERVNPEDSEADQAQDAEDEAAEVEATRTEALTLDDVKNAAMSYAQTFGMPATQEDGQKIMAKAFGEPPAGEKGWTIPMLKTVEQFETAVKFWTAAVNENPFKRTPV